MAKSNKARSASNGNANLGFEANPPFNDSDWRGELLKNDKRWVYGVPPAGTLAAVRDTLLPKLISGELRTRSLGACAQEMTS
jgi:hypothetical protein